MQSYTTDIETCQTESDRLTEELKQCSSSHDSLEPTGHIGISIIRQVENARETDVCIGTSTSVGYITSKSCCQADEMFLFELKTSTEIKIEENSIWIEDQICFINTTDTSKFDFQIFDGSETQSCTILVFDKSEGKVKERQLEVETNGCLNTPCALQFDSKLPHETILDGTVITCDQPTYFGIITKIENLNENQNIEFMTISKTNFERLEQLQKSENVAVEQVYEDVAGFESLRNLLTI